jgi:cysteine desulfurase
MENALRNLPGNPSSLHAAGRRAREAVESARASVALLLGAKPEEIVFTSGGTEANNLAVAGAAAAKDRALVLSTIEHASVLATAASLDKRGVTVRWIDPDAAGAVAAEAILEALGDGPVLVSLMLANNETGVLQPVREIARRADPARVLVHTDAVQAAGKVPIDVSDLGVRFLTLSAHKIGGPKGVGGLWARGGAFPRPILHGGGQEGGVRPGTENVPAIIGFGKAAELARIRLERNDSPQARWRDRFEADVLARVPGAFAVGRDATRLSNTSCLVFPGLEGNQLVALLDLKGIAASTGSACEAGSAEYSHVLRAMRVPPEAARGAVRFSMGHRATEEELLLAADLLVEAVGELVGL